MTEEPDKLDRFDTVLERLESPVTQIYVNQRQHKRVLRVLAVSLVFDILLSIGLGALALKTRGDVSVKTRATCVASNEFRRLDLERWNFLLSLQPTTKQTPQQQQNLALFRGFINQADALRPCG